jgi:AcrR family transcriptional regulator
MRRTLVDRSVSSRPKRELPPEPRPRERILEAAGRLFLRHGYRAVGVDTIVAEAGVAKMTLYAHFPSKDDLIVVYLERANEQFWAWLEGATAAAGDPRARLVAMFNAVGRLADSPQCLGCTFQEAVGEFPDPEHPGHWSTLLAAGSRRVPAERAR